LASGHDLQHHQLLQTGLGLSLDLYDTANHDAKGLILLLGRQHPPELTGAYAYQDFVERLFEADDMAGRFRQYYRLALVPVVNPDGVELGHWRMNRGGMDLNRDWGPFTQPETRAIADWLATAHGMTPLTLLLDFHSTWNDVLYGQHESDSPTPPDFNRAWYQAISARLREGAPAWSGQNNPGMPTAKSWARRVYGVSAITYEVGDRTPRDVIRHKARVAAEELMRVLLSLPGTD
jgi:predicted deacylase